jgi:hypothetical protein
MDAIEGTNGNYSIFKSRKFGQIRENPHSWAKVIACSDFASGQTSIGQNLKGLYRNSSF